MATCSSFSDDSDIDFDGFHGDLSSSRVEIDNFSDISVSSVNTNDLSDFSCEGSEEETVHVLPAEPHQHGDLPTLRDSQSQTSAGQLLVLPSLCLLMQRRLISSNSP